MVREAGELMPTFEITSPDGKVFHVDGPPGATEQDALAHIQSQYQPSEDAQPREQGVLEGMATGGGEAIANRGVGMFQLAKQLGVPVNKLFGLTPEEFDQVTQQAVKNNSDRAKGSGVSGAIAAMVADPLNLLPFGKAGKLALPLYGAVSGYTRGEQNDSNLTDRSFGAATEAAINTVAGKAIGAIGNKVANYVSPKSVIPDNMASTLLNENPDIKTYAGEELQSALTGAEKSAFDAKKAAYDAADPAMKKLFVKAANVKHGGFNEDIPEQIASASNITTDLNDLVGSAIKDFDSEVVKNKSSIENIMNDFNKEAASGNPSFDRIDLIRKRLYALPKANDAEAAVRARALSAYHQYADNILQSGIIEGDPAAIKLVADANAKNAYWRKNFTSKEANNAIRSFIDKEGGANEIAPENLLDKFINVGRAGYSNVKALKDVLGNNATPILQHGFYNKLRSQSLMPDGESINPAKMSKAINSFLDNNQNLANAVFKPNEIQALKKTASIADKYAKTGIVPKGAVARVMSHIPVFGPMIQQTFASRNYAKMTSDLAAPRADVNIGFVPINAANAFNNQQ